MLLFVGELLSLDSRSAISSALNLRILLEVSNREVVIWT